MNLAEGLVDFVNSLPSPGTIVQWAVEAINEALFDELKLCLAPGCTGQHVNSGLETNLVPGLNDLEILASHLIAHAYRIPPTQRTRIVRQFARAPPTRIALNTHCLGHTLKAVPRVV